MAPKHTQGPFKIVLNPRYMNASIYGKNRNHVAEVWGGKNPTMEIVEANARLLGHADRMLALLHDFINADRDGPEAMGEALEKARALTRQIECS